MNMEKKTTVPPSNIIAIIALVLGILAATTGWVPFAGIGLGIAAIILSAIALKKQQHKGLAVAGLVTGIVGGIWSLIVTAFFIALVLFGIGLAPVAAEFLEGVQKETQTKLTAQKDFQKGQTAVFGDYEVKVNSSSDYTPSEAYQVPADGKKFIVVNLTIKNIGISSGYVGTSTFTVDGTNSTYVQGKTPLASGSLDVDASVTGDVVYEVPANSSGWKLQYKETVLVLTGDKPSSKELTYSLAF